MNERKFITSALFLASMILFIFFRFISTDEEFRILGMMVVAGLISVSILVYALDRLIQIWLRQICNIIDFIIEEWFKECEKREKEKEKK